MVSLADTIGTPGCRHERHAGAPNHHDLHCRVAHGGIAVCVCGCLVSCCAFFRSATRVAKGVISTHWQAIVFDYSCSLPCTIYLSGTPCGTGQTANGRTYTINYGESSCSQTHGACLDRTGHPVCARSGNASRDTYSPISTQGQHCMPQALLSLFVGQCLFRFTIFLTNVANVISNGHS